MTNPEKWWKKHYKEAQRTQGKTEGLGVREEMARSYFEEGKYHEAADMWDEMAKIADKYPSTENESPQYRKMAKRNRDKASRNTQDSELEAGVSAASATTAIIGLLGGLFFFSSNITGNAVGLNQSSSNIFGAILLVIGLIGSFFWFRNKNK